MSNWNSVFIIILVFLPWWLPTDFAAAEPVEVTDVERFSADAGPNAGETWETSLGDWLTAERIYADNRGFIYMIGDYTGPVDFDPGMDIAMASPPEDRGAYLIRMNADGILCDLYTWQGRYDGFARG